MGAMVWTISSLLVGLTALVIIFVFTKYGTKKVHYIWAWFNIIVAVWGFGCVLGGLAKDNEWALYFWKFALFGGMLVPVGFYHVIATFGELKRKYVVAAFYFYSLAFYLFTVLDYVGLKVGNVYESFYYILPVDYKWRVFILGWLAIIVCGAWELTVLIRKSEGYRKSQYQDLFAGYIIGMMGGVVDVLPFFNIVSFPIGNILVWFYCMTATYTMFSRQLMGIEVIIRKTLVFAGLLASVFGMLILPTLVIQEYLLRGAGTIGRMTGLTISGIIIILTMRRIENFLINATDKYLFQKKYDYKELLKTFTNEVLTVLDINVLVHTTVDRLSNIVKTESCGLLLLNKTKNEYDLVASVGIDKDWRNITFTLDNTLTTFLNRTKSYLSTKHQGRDSPLPKRIIEDMNKLKLELAIPLFVHEDMIGILTLGKKKSDEEYTQDDMDILLPLARTLAIAISNAQMLVELSQTQAEAAQREKMAVVGTLSAGINHEICNPLGIARGQCEAFLLNIRDGLYKDKSPEELVEKATKIMEKVIHETDRATAITKRLSSFAKPSKGITADDVKIKDEIDEVLGLVGYELKLDKIDIVKEIDENLPLISADKKQLQEVFFNLIRNAAQAMGERGKITFRAKEKNDRILIEIEDTGHGIPEDKLEQIFNPFYTTKEPGKGTGLGLFIVRQVVERNRGRISVRSKVGEGTTFALEFPAAAKKVTT